MISPLLSRFTGPDKRRDAPLSVVYEGVLVERKCGGYARRSVRYLVYLVPSDSTSFILLAEIQPTCDSLQLGLLLIGEPLLPNGRRLHVSELQREYIVLFSILVPVSEDLGAAHDCYVGRHC